MVSRTGYAGELGYEVWCHPTHAVEVWDAVMMAGRPHGLALIGLQALDMLRIEAGIGFTVPARKSDEFVGKEALARRHANQQQRLVGLEIEGNEPIGHGDAVHRAAAGSAP